MDATRTATQPAAPAAAPDLDEPWRAVAPARLSEPAAATWDRRLATVVDRRNSTGADDAPAGGHGRGEGDTPSPAPSPIITTDPTPAPKPSPHAEPPVPAWASPLRAWDSERPHADTIGAWRWDKSGSDWRWQDARNERVDAPTWTKPAFPGQFQDFRVPLDSAIALKLYASDPDAAHTIAPGVVAWTAAAMSQGRLRSADDTGDLVPLMQRMTADRQLDLDRGLSALSEHGAPNGMQPYAVPIKRMASFLEDGTNNHRDAKKDHGGTNVAAMAALIQLGHLMDPEIPAPHYYAGVGNEIDNGPLVSLLGKATGFGMDGILAKVQRDFRTEVKGGATHFFVGGFSRGGASAVHSTNLFEDIISQGRSEYHLDHVALFDVVAAMGGRAGDHGDLRLDLPQGPGRPNRVYHTISQDEARDKFAFVNVGSTGTDNIVKDLVPGAHSDDGGSYGDKGLSNIVLHRHIEEAQRGGVPIMSVEEALARYPQKAAGLVGFLHQDHTTARHVEDAFYVRQTLDSRHLPLDAKPAEFPRVILDRREVVELTYNRDREFDRRSTEWRENRYTVLDHVDPDGRFRYVKNDVDPLAVVRPADAAASLRSRRDTDDGRGIVLGTVDETGRLSPSIPVLTEDPERDGGRRSHRR